MTHGRLVPALDRVVKARAELHSANVRLADAIREAKASGMTLQAIGDVLGLTRQRVKQMLDAERKP